MTHRRLLLIVVFIAIFSFDFARETDVDFWWHLETGRLIAATGAVPATDPFSYTAAGHPWVAHEWLWELGLYELFERGGYVSAVLVSALIVTLAFALLYLLLRRLGANEILSAALVLWAAALAVPNIGVRPRELTFLFLALYLHQLFLYRERRLRHLWLLPAAMVFWVNVHGAFVLGIGLLGLVALGETIAARWFGDPFPRHLWLVATAAVVAACFNPEGPRILLYPFSYYLEAGNPSFRIVSEFQSPNFHQAWNLIFAGGLIALMIWGVRRGRAGMTDGLLAGAFVLQALVSARQVAVAALVLAPILTLRLCEQFRWARALPPPRLPRTAGAINWILLVALLIAGALDVMRPATVRNLQLGAEPLPGKMPVAGARFIDEHHLPGPVFNDQAWGGYLIHRWYPKRRVFIDGRIDMYGPRISEEYIQVTTLQSQWSQVLDKYGVQTMLIARESALSNRLDLDPRWKRVFRGPVEDVYVRLEEPSPRAKRQKPRGAPAETT